MIIHGDSLVELAKLADNSVDSIITDPPYELTSIVKRFGKEGSAPAKFGTDGAFSRASKGFMGKTWDGTGIAYNVKLWQECLRVLKHGGHLAAFGGTRTHHRMVCAIEDAGFEIRDCLGWITGSGFPKSHNLHKADSRCPEGWGTALKPAIELISLSRKPLSEPTVAKNVLKWGTGGINIDGCRVDVNNEPAQGKTCCNTANANSTFGIGVDIKHDYYNNLGRFPANVILDDSDCVEEEFAKYGVSKSAQRTPSPNDHKGLNTTFARGSETSEHNDTGTVSRYFKHCEADYPPFFYSAKASQKERNMGLSNILIMEITLCEENTAQDISQLKDISELTQRWLTELFGKQLTELFQTDIAYTTKTETSKTTILVTLNLNHISNTRDYIVDVLKTNSTNGGSLVQSVENISELKPIITKELTDYISAANHVQLNNHVKVSVDVRENNFHPTCKPLSLMKYLITMFTPPQGIVLDPFAGSGSTLVAAKQLGFNFIGIELTAEYIPIINARLNAVEDKLL